MMKKPKRPNRAVPVWMRDDEIADVETAAARHGMTVSAYLRHCAQVVGGFQWAELVARGKYQRKGKQEGNDDQ